jgi:hypothetical protein
MNRSRNQRAGKLKSVGAVSAIERRSIIPLQSEDHHDDGVAGI